ncbi:hypothetical protein Ssi02_01880 [Sinosporangium siamense]|uniref:Uncharacterized protein n=1 Tax=Sinosporangium siamense TaxID=1367973 RepID=A0A919V5I5_9ACTN|nr:hypothetical protein Ssi02_01880 [Sinosporangium siamense]
MLIAPAGKAPDEGMGSPSGSLDGTYQVCTFAMDAIDGPMAPLYDPWKLKGNFPISNP